MVRAWNDIDWEQPRPSLQQLIDSWALLRWEARALNKPDVDRYLAEIARTHIDGGYLIGRWKAVAYSDVTQWFISRNRLEEYELIRELFSSQIFNEQLPELLVPEKLERVPAGLKEQWSGSLMLDGAWAGKIISGGAYKSFDGTAAEAKRLATAATDALIEDRFEDVRVDVTHEAWTPWFADVAWDATYVLTDTRNAELTVLCVTDTD